MPPLMPFENPCQKAFQQGRAPSKGSAAVTVEMPVAASGVPGTRAAATITATDGMRSASESTPLFRISNGK